MICYKCLQNIDISNITAGVDGDNVNSSSINTNVQSQPHSSSNPNPKIKHGLHAECFNEWFKLDDSSQLDFESLALRTGESSYSDHNMINTSFFAGAFKKYSARLNSKLYLLKVVMQEYPDLPKIEYICNLIAEHLGLNIPKFYLIRLENNVDCFVSYNFMQDHVKANLVHIFHFLDNTLSESREYYNCINLLNIVKHKTSSYDDIVQFIEVCLFDALIGNHDRHGRNLGLIQNSKRFILSPFYDNPSYLAIEDEFLLGAMHEPYGKIATSGNLNPVIKDYIQEFKNLGYEAEVLAFVKKINLDLITQIVQKPFLNIKRQEALIRLISRRYREALDAI
jgi:hypothetical protein